MPVRIHYHPTVLGNIGIAADDDIIVGVYLPREPRPNFEVKETDAIAEAEAQLDEYLSGKRRKFDLACEQEGTDFRKEVWDGMCQIPYGKTMTYGELAEYIGHRNAYRAVGTACGKNRLPIIVPCHRVTASDGMGDYSGGIEIKKHLLDLERENL